MQTLLAEAATEAQKRGGRKLTAYHLYVPFIPRDQMLDFETGLT